MAKTGYGDEFWSQVRRTYLEAAAAGKPITLEQVARLYGISPGTVQNRAANEGWAASAQLAAATSLSGGPETWIHQPIVQQATRDYLDQIGLDEAVASLSREAVAEQIDQTVRPYLEVVFHHVQRLGAISARATAKLEQMISSLPSSLKDATEQGMKPSDYVALVKVVRDLVVQFIEAERVLYGQSAHVTEHRHHVSLEASPSRVAEVAEGGVLAIADRLQQLGMLTVDALDDTNGSTEWETM